MMIKFVTYIFSTEFFQGKVDGEINPRHDNQQVQKSNQENYTSEINPRHDNQYEQKSNHVCYMPKGQKLIFYLLPFRLKFHKFFNC